MDARNITGFYDPLLIHKAKADELTGRNYELRHALKEARHEANIATRELEKAQSKVRMVDMIDFYRYKNYHLWITF